MVGIPCTLACGSGGGGGGRGDSLVEVGEAVEEGERKEVEEVESTMSPSDMSTDHRLKVHTFGDYIKLYNECM